MNKEINQLCQKINVQDILEKKFYPTWFFTNERLGNFLFKIENKDNIKNIFAIAGGGDFAFNCLVNFKDISEINVCDMRQLAGITVDLKVALIKQLPFEEMVTAFKSFKSNNVSKVYSKIKEEITSESNMVCDHVFENCKQKNFINCIKKSGYWYNYSFWQNGKDYLLYLNKEKYEKLKSRINKINIYCGDFNENLELFNNNFYDLIYVSNIFDSKKSCHAVDIYLKTIKEKINKNGYLLVVVQNNPNKMIKSIEHQGFKICQREIHRFSIVASIFGHYCYSFLLFKKNNNIY